MCPDQELQKGPGVPKRSTQIDAQGIATRHIHNRMGNFRQHGRGHVSERNRQGGRTDWDRILLANSYSPL